MLHSFATLWLQRARALMALLIIGASTHAAPLILNEYNAVASNRYLGGDSANSSTNRDTYFGRIRGNGGDWFELAVIQDHLDLRGWSFEWAYSGSPFDFGAGKITLSSDPRLSALRSGTLITITQPTTANQNLATDLSFNPSLGDWWINISAHDASLISTTGEVSSAGITFPLSAGQFVVDRDAWTLSIRNAAGDLVFGPAGEGAPLWTGEGINGLETAQLQDDPSFYTNPRSAYREALNSSFGAPNLWLDGVQDFTRLRSFATTAPRIVGIEPAGLYGFYLTWTSFRNIPYLIQHKRQVTDPWSDVLHVRGRTNLTAAAQYEGDRTRGFYRIAVPGPFTGRGPTLSIPSGEFDEPITVTIDPAGEVTHFTLDGEEPDYTTPALAGPITLTRTTALRASALRPGQEPSTNAVAFYAINEQLSLPIVGLVVDPADLYDADYGIYTNPLKTGEDWERPATFVYLNTNGVHAAAGLRIGGAFSRSNPKKSFRVSFEPPYGSGPVEQRLFSAKPRRVFDEVFLRANTNNILRDPLLTSLAHDVGAIVSANEYINLFVNSDYFGVYTMREHIDGRFLQENLAVTNATMVKAEDEMIVRESGDLQEWVALTNYFTTNTFVSPERFADASTRLDITNFTDYQILEIYAANLDWPQNNYYAFRDRRGDGRWKHIIWDADITFGVASLGIDQVEHDTLAWASRAEPRVDLAPPWLVTSGREASGGLLWSTLILRKLLENPAYQVQFANRFADLLNTTLSSANVVRRLDELVRQIAPDMPRDQERWGLPEDAWLEVPHTTVDFATRRPNAIRRYLAERVGSSGPAAITVSAAGGDARFRVNSIEIPSGWSGIYLRDIPITITALPAPGYRFVEWDSPTTSTSQSITIVPTEGLELRARFEPVP